MAIDKHAIVDFFRDSREGRTGGSRLLYDAASCLMGRILRGHDFDSLRALRHYCADTNHLRPWLPTRTDRVIFSEGLLEGLRDFESSRRHHRHRPYSTAKAEVA